MEFVLANGTKKASFLVEDSAFPGVRRIAGKVANDVKLVTDQLPELVSTLSETGEYVVLAATIGRSALLDQLVADGLLDIEVVKGLWEVYRFEILEAYGKKLLVIAGSDKRGTIYGLFHVSELLGVSPWVYFADVMPKKRASVVIGSANNFTSKVPSVKYRGIFINDEWPSFGNWTMSHFGGFTAEMYEHVFELILRLKGNYLWPAMWSSNFSLDGPGMANALLADEMGIVMSNSHHEPCLRHSEEWDMVRGEDTKYGNEWNFDRNREGLKEYWRDGLKRNGHLENIITIGMRGERDSEILGHDAGLAENIQYLKDVIATQNELIRECVNEDLEQVPRMIALYKEVESYYYGDETTPGLEGYPELDGVTLMLCEDNFGNMRSLPTEKNRDHKGGFGMYYHFDYHGGPISYEWVNSTFLPKVWEQMSMAYDAGVRDIWIVNTGDLKPQELPISYFLDLAYDFDEWGTKAVNTTAAYTAKWVQKQFAGVFDNEEMDDAFALITNYTKLNAGCRPEAMRPDTYHPVQRGKADEVLSALEWLKEKADHLMDKVVSVVEGEGGQLLSDSRYAAFVELLYYPVMASYNVMEWNIYAGKNAFYASQNRMIANTYADRMTECRQRDRELQKLYHSVCEGKWDHMMSSEHIGFINWNDEDCRMPVRHIVEPANKPRVLVAMSNSTEYSIGTAWLNCKLESYDLLDPWCERISVDVANCSDLPVKYTVRSDAAWLVPSVKEGEVVLQDRVICELHRDLMDASYENNTAVAHLYVDCACAHVMITVYALAEIDDIIETHYVPDAPKKQNLYLTLEASEFSSSQETEAGKFAVLLPYGKYESGVKAFPSITRFVPGVDAPSLTYECNLPKDGVYELEFVCAPSNPVCGDNLLRFGMQWNDEAIEILATVSESFAGGDTANSEWAMGVLANKHVVKARKCGVSGKNTICIYACDPAFVLERILIRCLSD